MFIISLTYKVPLEKVEEELNNHVQYLKEQYALGNFQASGRKVPRTGGVILSTVKDKKQLEEILAKDPFHKNDLADYTITEFIPSMTSEDLTCLLEV
ncbi:YciI family protein [Labilibaculum antarcticum]|uniref:GTP cyclohydrolase n=1 Tax=Labilibaculum antarcticum TaxID=1717717 RepID=A0A1Y1CJR6_9BACT|nr:YciI family protein [Labilibaculum antarcticum]BAX80636.1 GTP cyclohydrolase [Labilibaculum antarcticum]